MKNTENQWYAVKPVQWVHLRVPAIVDEVTKQGQTVHHYLLMLPQDVQAILSENHR